MADEDFEELSACEVDDARRAAAIELCTGGEGETGASVTGLFLRDNTLAALNNVSCAVADVAESCMPAAAPCDGERQLLLVMEGNSEDYGSARLDAVADSIADSLRCRVPRVVPLASATAVLSVTLPDGTTAAELKAAVTSRRCMHTRAPHIRTYVLAYLSTASCAG